MGRGDSGSRTTRSRTATPSFSPDGTQIALVHESNTWDQIYVMNTDGSNLTPRTGTFDYNSDPSYRVPDRLAPQTTIDAPPASPTNSARFAFSSSEVGSTFECALDDGAFGSCSSPRSVVAGDGSHTFRVRATDINGNVDPSAATYAFNLDTADPTVAPYSPADGATLARGVTVNADYSCADEAGGSGPATCVGDVPRGNAINTSTLGPKSLSVTATDNAGNEFTRTVNYTVTDQTDPTATITSPPMARASLAAGSSTRATARRRGRRVRGRELRRHGRKRIADRHDRLWPEVVRGHRDRQRRQRLHSHISLHDHRHRRPVGRDGLPRRRRELRPWRSRPRRLQLRGRGGRLGHRHLRWHRAGRIADRHDRLRPEELRRHRDRQRGQRLHAHDPLPGYRHRRPLGDDRLALRRRELRPRRARQRRFQLRRRGGRLRDCELCRHGRRRRSDRHFELRAEDLRGHRDRQRRQ